VTPAGRYDALAIALHWAIALLALVQIALGWWMIEIPKTPIGVRAAWFNVHKSIGLTIGLLMLARLGWRLVHRPPALPESLPRWQARAARASHALLYGALVAQPLAGYLGSSFTAYPIKYFGHTLPHWGWDSPPLKALCSEVHFALACGITALVALHVVAALAHLARGDGVFARMWPRAHRAERLLRSPGEGLLHR
jgi:cytochrome b561